MPKWRIIIPVAIVAIVGVIAYMQVSSNRTGDQSTAPPVASEPDAALDVTGSEDVDVQVDLLLNDLEKELVDEEQRVVADDDETATLVEDESALEMYDVQYYEE
jgi:hypothetical protein